MDELVRLVVTLAVLGVFVYFGVTVTSLLRKRVERSTLSSDELDELQARLAHVETMEGRIAELEERLDFAERLLSQPQEQPGALKPGQH